MQQQDRVLTAGGLPLGTVDDHRCLGPRHRGELAGGREPRSACPHDAGPLGGSDQPVEIGSGQQSPHLLVTTEVDAGPRCDA